MICERVQASEASGVGEGVEEEGVGKEGGGRKGWGRIPLCTD